jgi:hypothetical protein
VKWLIEVQIGAAPATCVTEVNAWPRRDDPAQIPDGGRFVPLLRVEPGARRRRRRLVAGDEGLTLLLHVHMHGVATRPLDEAALARFERLLDDHERRQLRLASAEWRAV